MTKLEAIDILKSLNERLKYVDDSYDKETDMKAIEIGIECIETCIGIEHYLEILWRSDNVYHRYEITKDDKIEPTDFDIFKELNGENQ